MVTLCGESQRMTSWMGSPLQHLVVGTTTSQGSVYSQVQCVLFGDEFVGERPI